MKILLLFIVLTPLLAGRPKSQPDKILLITAQIPWQRCIPTTKDDFWLDQKYFDTTRIFDKTSVTYINQCLSNLAKKGSYDITYEACLIRFRKGKAIDTFFSWRSFDYFKKGSVMYYDSTKRLSKLLRSLDHHTWQDN
jgi:hypothetical protein